MLRPLSLLCACALIPGAADAAATIVQTTSAVSAAHGGTHVGSIDQYDGAIWQVQVDVSGGASAEGYDPFDPAEAVASGIAAGYLISGANSLGFSGPLTIGTASCVLSFCQASFQSSFSQSFWGADIALFRGTGTVLYADWSSIFPSFPVDASRGSSTVTVTYYLGAPEPGTWAMMVGGFGLVGAAMRRRRRMAVI